jgi:hypothetical protein
MGSLEDAPFYILLVLCVVSILARLSILFS